MREINHLKECYWQGNMVMEKCFYWQDSFGPALICLIKLCFRAWEECCMQGECPSGSRNHVLYLYSETTSWFEGSFSVSTVAEKCYPKCFLTETSINKSWIRESSISYHLVTASIPYAITFCPIGYGSICMYFFFSYFLHIFSKTGMPVLVLNGRLFMYFLKNIFCLILLKVYLVIFTKKMAAHLFWGSTNHSSSHSHPLGGKKYCCFSFILPVTSE